MNVDVNGAARELPDGTTLHELILDAMGTLRGSAAAVDGEVVPRSDWEKFRMHDGQRVELITAVQGG